jgi:AraC-like DNA-binding protein
MSNVRPRPSGESSRSAHRNSASSAQSGLAHRHGAGAPGRAGDRTLGVVQRRRLTDLIQQQLGAKLSLSRLAQEVGLSPQHFARLFKATFGTTPHQYVQTLRIEAALEVLRRDPAVPLAQIALACGFASHSHMTALMRRRLGVRPSTLRRDRAVTPRPLRSRG